MLRDWIVDELATLLDHPVSILLTGSCTHALEAAALLSMVGPGDEVIVPAFTFPSTANAFLLRGATVRFADVELSTGNVDPSSVAERISERTRVIVPVHYGGVSADMDVLLPLASRHGAMIIEDAAQAIHARLDGVPLGRLGPLGALSFHRTKNVVAGDGGALVINDPDLVEAAHQMIDKGTNRTLFTAGLVDAYEWTSLGSAWHMPDPAIATIAASLHERDHVQAARHHVWQRYMQALAPWASDHGVRLPIIHDGVDHPAHLFWLGLPSASLRWSVVEHCRARGVEVARHFGSLPDSTYGQTIAAADDKCPVATLFAESLLRLPLHHQLDDTSVDRVIEAVTSAPL